MAIAFMAQLVSMGCLEPTEGDGSMPLTMRRLWRSFAISCFMLASVVPFGCGSDDSEKPADTDTEGLRLCCELGAICHQPGQQTEDVRRCHNIGHLNDPAECRANYDECLALCAPLGEGGGGGEPAEHACIE